MMASARSLSRVLLMKSSARKLVAEEPFFTHRLTKCTASRVGDNGAGVSLATIAFASVSSRGPSSSVLCTASQTNALLNLSTGASRMVHSRQVRKRPSMTGRNGSTSPLATPSQSRTEAVAFAEETPATTTNPELFSGQGTGETGVDAVRLQEGNSRLELSAGTSAASRVLTNAFDHIQGQPPTTDDMTSDTDAAEEQSGKGEDHTLFLASTSSTDVSGDTGQANLEYSLITNINLPSGRHARVKSAVFVKSSSKVDQCPKSNLPEFAVIGRSNVGKSSLINMLTSRKDLASISKKPGKTQLINHFLINDKWHLVDLPGYGFAVAPSAVRTTWNDFTKDYFLNREQLVTVLLLVDASIPPQAIDLECADWLGEHKVPVTIVFTKCDKRKKKHAKGRPPAENAAEFREQLGEVYSETPPWVMTSAVNAMGRDVLLQHIASLREFWRQ